MAAPVQYWRGIGQRLECWITGGFVTRRKNYQTLLVACREQSTGWLQRCYAEPSPWQNELARLAVRNALRERAVPFIDVTRITEGDMTCQLSRAIRCF